MTHATTHLVFGPSGAGKTTFSKSLADEIKGIHFSIDAWMVQLYGPDVPSPLDPAWLFERVQRCEEQIWSTAAKLAELRIETVLDLGFMRVNDREKFIGLAREKNIPFQSHFLAASKTVRWHRVRARNLEQGETFTIEVSPEMFSFAEQIFEEPNAAELESVKVYRT